MDDNFPATEPHASLTPPPLKPPVATGADYLPIPPEPFRRRDDLLEETAAFVGTIARRTLDVLDDVGDAIARTVGLRA